MNEKWYSLSISEIEKKLNTNAASGLSRKAARSRLEKVGRNNFFLFPRKPVLDCILEILFDPSMILLAATAIIAAIFEHGTLAIVTLSILFFNLQRIIFSYIKAQRTIESATLYAHPEIKVIRSGKVFLVDCRSIVPGDVIILNEGDIIPCDARLVADSSLEVLTYVYGDGGEGEYKKIERKAEFSYTVELENIIVNAQNMVFAGSVVARGSARAIVVETDLNTYNGALNGGMELGVKHEELRVLHDVKKYCTKYSLYILLLIVPVSLIGILAAGERFDLLDVFMLALSLSASTMSEMLNAFATIVVSRGIVRAGSHKLNSAIIKSVDKIDELTHLDYLFLVGKSAISDGKLHVSAVFENGAIVDIPEENSNKDREQNESLLNKLAKLFYIGMNNSPSARATAAEPYFDGYCEYEKAFADCSDELNNKFRSGSFLPPTKSNGYVGASSVYGSNSRFVIFNSHSLDILKKCRFVRSFGEEKPMLPENFDSVLRSLKPYLDNGCRVSIFASANMNGDSLTRGADIPDQLIFEGAYIYKEYINKNLSTCIETLNEAGVKTKLFLPEESRSALSFAIGSGFTDSMGNIAIASQIKDRGLSLLDQDVISEYSTFVGFSYEEIYALVKHLQSQSKTVAAEGMMHREYLPLFAADVMFTCDTADYSPRANIDILADDISADGMAQSKRASQSMKKNADVLIKRATRYGGGINGILGAIIQSIGIYRNLLNVLRYLVCSFVMRMMIVVPPLLLGICMLSPTQILVTGLFIDGYAIAILATDSPKQLRHKGRFDYRTEFADLFKRNAKLMTCCSICGACIWVVLLVFHLFGLVVSVQSAQAYAFVVTIALQIAVFVLIRRKIFINSFSIRPNIMGLISLCVLFGFLLIAFIVPSIGDIVGVSGLTVPLILALPIVPALLIGLYFAVCKKRIEK